MKRSADSSREPNIRVSAARATAAAFGCGAALLHCFTPAIAADIAIPQAWSRATPKGAEVAAGYLTIENRGDSADRLLSASTSIAGKTEIHEILAAHGVMKMRPAREGLTIPPHGKLILAPGGSHLMFVALRAPFAEGEQVPASLEFEKAGQINISLQVAGIGANHPQLSPISRGTVRSTAKEADPFFTHIHAPRLMANVTVSPGQSGPVEVLVQLEDPQENALAAKALSVVLTNSDKRKRSDPASAERIAIDTWRARMVVSEAGKWNLMLRIALAADDKIEIAAPILIE
jgi:copper(I)-binding protein